MSAVEVVEAYLSELPGPWRRLARGEWGLSLEPEVAGGHPLEVGLRIAEELLRAQAFAVGADSALDPALLLHWNRQTRIVRFATTREGDVWVQGDAPVAGLDGRGVDRMLGLLVQGAVRAREYAAASNGGAAPERPWLPGAARRRAID